MNREDREQKLINLNNTVRRSAMNFKPPEQITVQKWAEKYRRLSPENSAEPGRYRTDRTPYLAEPMAAFTDSKIQRIVVVASAQVGKTEMEMNMLGYAIDIDPGPVMWVTPTQDNAEDFSKRRIAPMIRDTRPLKAKIEPSKGRNKDNTVLKKKYPGGMLTMTGSNSPANLAATPSRYVFGDELDRWAKDAGGEGDPWSLLEARTITFYNHKMVQVSTPTIKGESAIETAFLLGTQEYWSAQCPHCGEYNFVEFDHIRFQYDSEVIGGKKQFFVKEVLYACPCCGCASTEMEIKKSEHKWIAKNPEAYNKGIRSFWINAFASPWMSWDKIVIKFLEADGDPDKLKTVFNTLFGQLWEDRGNLMTDDELYENREEYEAELPDGVLCLTCGVDTQDNRLEYEVVGHGMYYETWGIEKGIIVGKPDEEDKPDMQSVWTRLDGIIDKLYSFKDGMQLKISITFVDSGGHYTQEVYEQCAKRINKRVFAIKGQFGEGTPYTKPPSKVNIVKTDKNGRKRICGKAWLYMIGVDSGKEKIMSALEVKTSGARYCHFPINSGKGYDKQYFNGLLSEKMTYRNGKWMWVKLPGHERNEPLDLRNYANAAFTALNPNMDALREIRLGAKSVKEASKPKKAVKKQKKGNINYGEL